MSKALLSKLIETESFDEIFKHLAPDTLVICDIDNTLIEPDQHLGSVQWGENLIKNLITSGKSHEEAEQTVHKLWLILLPKANMRLIDINAPSILLQVTQEEATVLGLTARHPEEAYFTHPQLSKVGVSFDSPKARTYIAPALELSASYDQGILFGGTYNKKGDVLISFLQENNYKPNRIIFVDDKWSHVKDVERAATSMNIDYVGLRFSKADHRIKEYHDTIADIHWKYFPSILTDTEAQEILINKKF